MLTRHFAYWPRRVPNLPKSASGTVLWRALQEQERERSREP